MKKLVFAAVAAVALTASVSFVACNNNNAPAEDTIATDTIVEEEVVVCDSVCCDSVACDTVAE